jgi:hypothetical protein
MSETITADDVGAAATLCPTGRQVTLNSVYGLMVVPWCPHEGCGWSMPELTCPQHGNFGMTFLSVRLGALTHVKAVLT